MTETPAQSRDSKKALPVGASSAWPKEVHAGWVLDEPTLAGMGKFLTSLVVGLMDEIVRVTIFCPESADVSELPEPPVEVARYRNRGLLGMPSRELERLADEITDRKIRILHALDVGSAKLAGKLSELSSLPLIVTANKLGDSRRLRKLPGHLKCIMAGSEQIQLDLATHKVVPVADVLLVRPGGYLVRHATCFNELDSVSAVVVGGPMDQPEHYQAVLEAYRAVRGSDPPVGLFIIGNGRAEPRIRKEMEKLGLRQEITFVDRMKTSTLPGIFKAADVYISPSPMKRLDIPSFLAVSAGVPVLAAHGGGTDFLIDGRTALRFNPGDADDLTRKLRNILEDHAFARQIAENALDYLRENHSASAMVSAVAGAYRDVLAGQ
ncbi:MAG: glycosyltransferase family 4 protein [Phycisphaerae bacterium]